MSLPRHCKICRLILNYPTYDPADDAFVGMGHCPSQHYTITLTKDEDDLLEDVIEKFIFADFTLVIIHDDNIMNLYKNGYFVTSIKGIQNYNFRNPEDVISKLDTLVNFS